MFIRDLKVEVVRDENLYWRGLGTITHVPSGKSVEFQETWADCTERGLALLKLRKLVDEEAVPCHS